MPREHRNTSQKQSHSSDGTYQPRIFLPAGRKIRVMDVVLALCVIGILVLAVYLFIQGAKNQITADSTNPTNVIISEYMADNSSAYYSADGNAYDWIEIYNPTSRAISMTGYGLSDNLEKPDKFVFPDAIIPAGGFLVVFASDAPVPPNSDEYHAAFKLSSMGENIYLFDAHNNMLDSASYESLGQNYSMARDLTDLSIWNNTTQYTPGFPNTNDGWAQFNAARTVPDSPIVISEVMTNNQITIRDEDNDPSDWIELYNSSDQTVDLTNYGLSNEDTSMKKWVFPEGTTLAAGEYRIIYTSGKNKIDPSAELHTSFKLSSMGTPLLLTDVQGQILQKLDVPQLPTDQSYHRNADGSYAISSQPTPGLENTSLGFNEYQKHFLSLNTTGLIISEVVSSAVTTDDANPAYDWIELQNTGPDPINLKDYGLTDNSSRLGEWKFPDTTVQPGGFIVVYASALDKTDDNGALHANFSLSVSGEIVVLTQPDNTVLDACYLPMLPPGFSYGRSTSDKSYVYLSAPTPGTVNTQDEYYGMTGIPNFSINSGQYGETLSVSCSAPPDSTVYYTTDGSEPDETDNRYQGPITVSSTTVLRARAFSTGNLPSITKTASYFINESDTLPIVSLVSDPDNFFSESKGIYAMGPGASSTYPYKGANFWKEWEVPTNVELIETNNAVPINQQCGIRIYGAYSRANESKSFALMARGEYSGQSSFHYAIFPDRPYDDYQSFILRNGASEWNVSKIRDVTQSSLARDTTTLDVQAFRPCAVYINGEYFGVYFMQEKINKDYIASLYNVSPESVNLLVGNSVAQFGSNQDFKDLLDYVKNHDLSVPENYEYIKTKMDVENFADYVIIEIYSGNTDTGNIKYWMSPEYDGKWRWILYDLDWGFLKVTPDSGPNYIDQYLNDVGHGVGRMFDTTLIMGLLKNPDFKQLFLERYAYHINVTFDPTRCIERIDNISALIDAEMPRDKEKWGYGDYDSWVRQIDKLRDFARKRPDVAKIEMQNYFGLSDDDMNKYFE